MINTQERLAECVGRLLSADWIAMDTEADSLHAYPEKLCLIQISIAGADELFDPLANLNLAPLWSALQSRELIMHGADYDLRLLRKTHQFVPEAIFDTMIASRLLGIKEFGLNSLLTRWLGVTLEKGSQKADWGRRPLTERMETYARNDTRYLKPLSDILRAELEQKGRLAWHKESCDRLILECSAPGVADPEIVWRIKGSHILSRAGLAVLREVSAWREKEAVGANKPPYFILRHESLVAIAAEAIDGRPWDRLIPIKFSARRRRALVDAVEKGLAAPPENHPLIRRNVSRRPTEAEKQRYHELEKKRNQRAAELEIDPTLIASRSGLFLLAQDWSKHQAGLMNWQRELLQ
jgi:ribonuclease D